MIGEILGNYRLMRVLGRGGMGVVYLGQHVLIGTKVAVKVLNPELSVNVTMVNRFFNEARAAAMIDHPGITQVFDFGRHGQSAYLVMEFLQGESLSTRLRREGRMDGATATPIVRQIAAAVGAAHGAGIVHRDLKPDNVFLLPDEEVAAGVRVKVLDFGVAKLAGEMSAHQTGSGSLLGTPTYMSPEQCRGAGEVDTRSDIYSLGCILYKMLTGRRPFNGAGPGEIIAAHLMQQPQPPSALAPSLPPALEAVVLRALAKLPEHRQQTMAELASELELVRRTGTATPVAGVTSLSTPGYLVSEGEVSMPGLPISVAEEIDSLATPTSAAPMTLGTVAGESVVSPPPRPKPTRRRGALIVIAGVVLGVVAAVIVVVSQTGGPDVEPAPPSPAAKPAAPAAAIPAPLPAAPQPGVAAAPDAGAPADVVIEVAAPRPPPPRRIKPKPPRKKPGATDSIKRGTIDPFDE